MPYTTYANQKSIRIHKPAVSRDFLQIDNKEDAIKAHMTEADTDTITAGAFKVTWKAVTSTRIDTTALRKDLPEIWQEYGKTTTTRRFSVAVAN